MIRSTTAHCCRGPKDQTVVKPGQIWSLNSGTVSRQFHGHKFTVSKLCAEGAVGFVLDVDRTRLLARWSDLVDDQGLTAMQLIGDFGTAASRHGRRSDDLDRVAELGGIND